MTKYARATLDDATALARILGDWIAETDWMPELHSAEDHRNFLARLIAECEVILARREQPVGFVALRGDEVAALYVASDRRNRGIGSGLLDRAKQHRARLGLWTFQANSGARRFYARQGFVEVRQTDGADNDEKLPDVYLQWRRETET